MDKYVNIEWPYERIVLNMNMPKQRPVPLTHPQWVALKKAEEPFYKNGGGGHAYTDIQTREDDHLGVLIWEQCQLGVEGTWEYGNWEDQPEHVQNAHIARRVAQTFALMAFGAEILLK